MAKRYNSLKGKFSCVWGFLRVFSYLQLYRALLGTYFWQKRPNNESYCVYNVKKCYSYCNQPTGFRFICSHLCAELKKALRSF